MAAFNWSRENRRQSELSSADMAMAFGYLVMVELEWCRVEEEWGEEGPVDDRMSKAVAL